MSGTRIAGLWVCALAALTASAPAATPAYEYDAATVTGGDTAWDSTTTQQDRNWAFGTGLSLAAGDPSPATSIDAAVVFDASDRGSTDAFDPLRNDIGIELWIKPDSLDPDGQGGAVITKQAVIESGGPSGFGISLWDDTVKAAVNRSGEAADPDVILSHTLTSTDVTDFVQIVFTVDATGETFRLYVNPAAGAASPDTPVDSTTTAPKNWSGQNPAGLGGVAGRMGASNRKVSTSGWYSPNETGGVFSQFEGQIGLVRLYDDVLSGADVAASYNDIMPATILGDVNGDGVVDGLDIQPFVDLLTGGGYQAEADINADAVVDGLDIQPFVDIITGAGGNPVPEPATLSLLALGGIALRRRRTG